MQPPVSSINLLRFERGDQEERTDLLVREEPLEIRVGYGPADDRQVCPVSVTMRTPGNDFELAAGFLYTEGILREFDTISSIRYCRDSGKAEDQENIVRVELVPRFMPDLGSLERNFYTTSSCGICGKASIDAVRSVCPVHPAGSGPYVNASLLPELPLMLRERQTVFAHTGGIHACGLFNTDGSILYLREDIGRHNALDKVIGAGFAAGELPFDDHILLLSGRAGFEMIQKAAMAGIRIIAAVGAPSSLAVSMAEASGITLIGFLRDQRFNCYSGSHRILS